MHTTKLTRECGGLGVGGGRRQQMDSGGEGVGKVLNREGLVGGGKEGKEK